MPRVMTRVTATDTATVTATDTAMATATLTPMATGMRKSFSQPLTSIECAILPSDRETGGPSTRGVCLSFAPG